MSDNKPPSDLPKDGPGQLKLALDTAIAASKIRFDSKLQKQVTDFLGPVFEEKKDRFKDFHEQILKSADHLGQIAGLLAEVDGKNEVSLEHFHAARQAVKEFCPAGRPPKEGDGAKILWEWCGK